MTKNRISFDDKTIEKLKKYDYRDKISKFIDKIDNDYKNSVQLAEILKKEISLTPGNIDNAIKRTCEKTKYCYATLKARYYSKKPHYNYSKYFPDPCSKINMEANFYIIGSDGILQNTKITSNEKDYKKNKFIFTLLKKILKL